MKLTFDLIPVAPSKNCKNEFTDLVVIQMSQLREI